jgi:hypothetical protein
MVAKKGGCPPSLPPSARTALVAFPENFAPKAVPAPTRTSDHSAVRLIGSSALRRYRYQRQYDFFIFLEFFARPKGGPRRRFSPWIWVHEFAEAAGKCRDRIDLLMSSELPPLRGIVPLNPTNRRHRPSAPCWSRAAGIAARDDAVRAGRDARTGRGRAWTSTPSGR